MHRCINCQVQCRSILSACVGFFSNENNHKTSFLMNGIENDHYKH